VQHQTPRISPSSRRDLPNALEEFVFSLHGHPVPDLLSVIPSNPRTVTYNIVEDQRVQRLVLVSRESARQLCVLADRADHLQHRHAVPAGHLLEDSLLRELF